MSAERRTAHWLVDVLERASRAQVAPLDLNGGSSQEAVWAAVGAAYGLNPGELAELVARHFRLAVADLQTAQPRAVRLVTDGLARRHLILPLRESDRELVVATADPTNLEAEKELGFVSGRTPVFAVAPPDALQTAIGTWYAPNRLVASLVESVADDAADLVQLIDEGPVEQVTEEDVESEPVVKLTAVILRDAIVQRASDIHFEPGRDGAAVRFRVDGVLKRHVLLPMPALTRVLSRIKIMGRLDIADRLRPQDGRARVMVQGREYDLRISTVPTRDAEKVVIRILNTRQTTSLEECGLPAPELERLRQVVGQRDGIVVVTGPTGSGKTTTLYSAIRELATVEVNVMTVEDPVEYDLPGITQIQVEPKRGVTFVSALRAILRQDPDVILVGEIRDLETAEVAVQASMTGHLVLATLHTNDAIGVIQRLVDLGLDRSSIADSLRAALAQRLVRRFCPSCARPANGRLPETEARLAARYGLTPPKVAVGCAECAHTGYLGRLPIVEVLTVDRRVRDLIARGATSSEILDASRAAGMRGLEETALEPVRAGLTSLSEIARELGEPSVPPAPSEESDEPTILLVDDDAVNRTLARKLLQKHGYRVTEAGDGLEALDRLAQERFTLMVLDLDMPRMGGREVLHRVRADVATVALPVVVLTGTHDENAEIEVMEAGADDYVRKPIDPPRFAARVKAALRRAAI
jgi:type II secretory ATPase GspE/PulE/Tfp pilus assembly ATPase PilB-like protein/ActR/RegA family two-component response regulator